LHKLSIQPVKGKICLEIAFAVRNECCGAAFNFLVAAGRRHFEIICCVSGNNLFFSLKEYASLNKEMPFLISFNHYSS